MFSSMWQKSRRSAHIRVDGGELEVKCIAGESDRICDIRARLFCQTIFGQRAVILEADELNSFRPMRQRR